jgi:hypothetical protein
VLAARQLGIAEIPVMVAYNLRFAYKLEGKIKIEIEVERQAGE